MCIEVCLIDVQLMLVVYNHNFSNSMERNLLWNTFDVIANKVFIHWDEIIGILQTMNPKFLDSKQRHLLLCAAGPHWYPKI